EYLGILITIWLGIGNIGMLFSGSGLQALGLVSMGTSISRHASKAKAQYFPQLYIPLRLYNRLHLTASLST
ncbi:MAG: hypothetical protein AAB209_08105, partial [Bacteroidota bacterium]